MEKSDCKIDKATKTKKKKGYSFWAGGVRVKWHTLNYKNGSEFKVQGSYELQYAKYLLENDINFIAHPKVALKYKDRFGGTHSYKPDFWVDEIGYVEIKSNYTFKKDKKKIEEIIESGIKLTVLKEKELNELGVKGIRKVKKE